MVKYMQMDVDSLHNSMNSLLTREYFIFFIPVHFFHEKKIKILFISCFADYNSMSINGLKERETNVHLLPLPLLHKKKYENKNFSHSQGRKGENFALNIYEGAHGEINFCRSSKTDDSSPFFFFKAWIFFRPIIITAVDDNLLPINRLNFIEFHDTRRRIEIK